MPLYLLVYSTHGSFLTSTPLLGEGGVIMHAVRTTCYPCPTLGQHATLFLPIPWPCGVSALLHHLQELLLFYLYPCPLRWICGFLILRTGFSGIYIYELCLPFVLPTISLIFLYLCRQKNSKSAQMLYKTSLYYILLLSIALIVDRKLLHVEVKTTSEDYKLALS